MYESLGEASGRTVTPETPFEELAAWAAELGIEVPHPIHGKYVEELWEHFVKPGLVRPTFTSEPGLDIRGGAGQVRTQQAQDDACLADEAHACLLL